MGQQLLLQSQSCNYAQAYHANEPAQCTNIFELIFHSLSIHFPCPFWVRAGWAWLCYYFLFILPALFGPRAGQSAPTFDLFFLFFWLRAGWWVWLCYNSLFMFLVFFSAPSWPVGLALPLLSIHFPFPFCGPGLAAGRGSPTTFYSFSLLF